MTFGLTSLVVTSMLSVCFGFVTGGMMAGAKVADLHYRIDDAEQRLSKQMETIQDLSKVLTMVLAELEAATAENGTLDLIRTARSALTRQ